MFVNATPAGDVQTRRTLAPCTGALIGLSGRQKEGGYARRKPSLPKMPWDDKSEDGDGGA